MSGKGPRFLGEEPASGSTPASVPRAAPPPDPTPREPDLPRGPILLDAEPDAPTTLGTKWEPESLGPQPDSLHRTLWVLIGVVTIIVSFAVFSCIGFILAMSDRSMVLGALAALAVGGGLVMIGIGLAGEWTDHRRLRMVDATRVALGRHDQSVDASRAVALAWLRLVAGQVPEASEAEQAVRAATTSVEINAILRGRVVEPLRAAAVRIGQNAAVEGGALIAISPHASWDGVIAGLRGIAVIRRVARLYGLRPGPVVTMALLRHVAWTAAGTTGIDLLSQTLADKPLSELPVARHILSMLPGTGLAAMRLYRLASVTAEACCPVPR